jgi:hypothetical protein
VPVIIRGSRYQNWTDASPAGHTFTFSVTYSDNVVRDAFIVRLRTGKSIHTLFAGERKR